MFSSITITRLRYFTAIKNDNFQMKICDIFLIFAQNIDHGYTLDPPQCEAVLTSTHDLYFREKMYTPLNPSFTI